MCSFLKGRRLWRYITETIIQPIQKKDKDAENFVDRLKEWDSKNHQISTWFRNTSQLSIHLQFGQFDTTKSLWDFLAHYYTTVNLSHQYQLLQTLHQLRQELGQSIDDFHSHHYEKDCPNKGKQLVPKDAPLKSNPLFAAVVNDNSSVQANIEQSLFSTSITISDLESLLQQLLQKSDNTSISASSISSGNSSWYFDSACCNHMTPDSTFKSIVSNSPDIHTANESSMPISHIGSKDGTHTWDKP
ncbi:hypothetical protein WN943_019556 [Citrus x changshan-huyou]